MVVNGFSSIRCASALGRVGARLWVRVVRACVVVLVVVCCVSCGVVPAVVKGALMDDYGYSGPRLTRAQATEQVFVVTREFLSVTRWEIDSIDLVFDSCNDQNDPPYQAAIYGVFRDPWRPARLGSQAEVDRVRGALLALPGWHTVGPEYHSYDSVVMRGEFHVGLPEYPMSPTFNVSGPCAVDENLKEVLDGSDAMGVPFGPTDFNDVTKVFFPDYKKKPQ